MDDFEKLGVFYLGKTYDLERKSRTERLLLYDSKDLVTHGVCVGMTGSGKTGLCLSLIEEAAIDGIPCIAIDPKGDISNLLLNFPKLSADEFLPWVNEEDARRRGMSTPEFAKQQAEQWKNGLKEWGQDGARIQRLRDAADFSIYTPGSSAGIAVSIVKSFAAPPAEILEDNELLGERVSTTVTSLLALLGIEGDAMQGREHILLALIVNAAWKARRDIDLGALIQQIQTPPMTRVGVIDLESFYPAKERFALAMRLNNLLAAPGFEAWLSGEALDIGAMLHSPKGKPRVSIFSIAHLNDTERMFFVSLLLNAIVGWMRTQSGTSSLRALIYMDEIFGFFPPVANPPSKLPLLTLLKQARAFGVGVLLATQNPVDLDYKGLANTGTWFLGRLQTERDKLRVLDGLQSVTATSGQSFDRAAVDRMLSGLQSRVFVMNNVHENGMEVFESRWALSYLRGPLTRAQIKQLSRAQASTGAATIDEAAPANAPLPARRAEVQRPVLPPQIKEAYFAIRSAQPADAELLYAPMLMGCGAVYFSDGKSKIDQSERVCLLVEPSDSGAVDWQAAAKSEIGEAELESAPADDAGFMKLPSPLAQPKNYEAYKKALNESLFRTQKLELFRSAVLGQTSKPGETEREFRVRLQEAARSARDLHAEKLRQKYAPKIAMIEEKIRRAQQTVDREQEQVAQSGWQTALSVGSSVLGAFLGRKTISMANVSRASTAARSVGRTLKERQDATRAGETVEVLQQQLVDLEYEFKEETDKLIETINPGLEVLDTIVIKPKRTDVKAETVLLIWAPYWQSGAERSSAWI